MAVIKTSGGKVVATSGGRVSVGNCGTGAGGFQIGNTCAKGGGTAGDTKVEVSSGGSRAIEMDAAEAIQKVSDAGVPMPARIVADAERFAAFGDKRSAVPAMYVAHSDTVYVNPDAKHYKKSAPKRSESLAHNGDTGWLSTSEDTHLLVHEMGHGAHSKHAPDFYIQHRGITGEAKRELEGKVSRYAMSNANEFVAETFTGVVHGKTYGPEVEKWYRAFKGPPIKGFGA